MQKQSALLTIQQSKMSHASAKPDRHKLYPKSCK